MKVCLVTPYFEPSVRGNSITVQRIARGLIQRDVDVGVLSLENVPEGQPAAVAAAFEPDVIHAFHAHRSAAAVSEMLSVHSSAVVTTVTGTDVNHDLFDLQRRAAVLEQLHRSKRIVAFHDSMQQKLIAAVPEFASKIVIIPQSVRLEQSEFLAGFLTRMTGDEIVFLLPAGIRQVKNVLFPLNPMTQLHQKYPNVRLIYAGPIIEMDVFQRLQAALEKREDWAFFIGAVQHKRMWGLLQKTDVVLNTSISEGGMANSVLEAMSVGVPVLASDIEGNRSVVEEGGTGFIYTDEDDFIAKAERLIGDEDLRLELGKNAKAKYQREFSWQQEIEAHLRVYQEVLGSQF
jgi:glycosyltransferase involved in cell wall biosynthesis